ncbi:MAG: hypothetical protein IPM57_11375 [Oligoflexia bacterium]|nr:hypothetical protein [Oligoflexia bacterium]
MSKPYLFIFIFVGFLNSSCFLQKSIDTDDGPKITFAFSNYAPSLDWQKKLTLPATIAITNMLCGLVDYDYDNFQAFIVPSCAQNWEAHQNFTQWVFKIKKDIKWSDGKPLTAEHFISSFKRLLQPDMHSPYARILFSVKNAKKFYLGEIKNFEEVGIIKTDDYTLQFILEAPYERFIYNLAHPSTYPIREEHEKMFNTIKKQLDTIPWLGPYKLIHHTKKRIGLLNYVDATGVVKRFDLLTDVKKEKLSRMIKENKAQIIFDFDDLKMRNIRRFKLPAFEMIFAHFITKNKPLNNPIMRRIFSHCINKDDLTLIEPQTASLGGVIPPGVEGYESNRGTRFDPEMAKLVLRNAKYEPEIKKYEYPLYVQTQDLLPIAKNLKDQWKKCLNLDVKIMSEPYDGKAKVMGIVLEKVLGLSLDPSYYLNLFDKKSDFNMTGWRNYEFDQYLKKPKLAKAQHMLVEEEIPVLPLLSYFHTVVTRSEVRGLKQNFNRYIDLRSISLERTR